MVYLVFLFCLLLLFLPIYVEIVIKNSEIKLIVYRLIIINLNKKENNNKMKKSKRNKMHIDYKNLLLNKKNIIYVLLKFLKTTYVNLKLRLSIATNDAFNTALLYGTSNTLIYGIIGYLSIYNNFKHDINITCDFNSKKINIYFNISVIFNMFSIILLILRLYKIIKKSLKGGVEHVRTSNRSFNENYNG